MQHKTTNFTFPTRVKPINWTLETLSDGCVPISTSDETTRGWGRGTGRRRRARGGRPETVKLQALKFTSCDQIVSDARVTDQNGK